MQNVQSVWNSLEIIKLIVAASTPIVVIIIGYLINKALKKYENIQVRNRTILEKRLKIYDIVVPKLNDLLCFHCFIGNWKELTPIKIIEHKRFLDKKMYIYAPLFSEEIINRYNDFIHICFETYSGWGHDAKIRSLYKRREEYNKKWNKKWNLLFSDNQNEELDSIKEKKMIYNSLMSVFQKDLDIFRKM